MKNLRKIIAIGDIHTSNRWKEVIEREKNADKIIFIADYFDTYNKGVSITEEIHNAKEIVSYKLENPDKVILLIGNHDYHYLPNVSESYSGFKSSLKLNLINFWNENLKYFKMCHIENDIIFTHAGVSKSWLKRFDIKQDSKNLEQDINELFKSKPDAFNFSGYNPYGDDVSQSPIWIRPKSLLKDGIDNYTQIVGHTSMSEIKKYESKPIIVIDAFCEREDGEPSEYLEILISDNKETKFNIKQL